MNLNDNAKLKIRLDVGGKVLNLAEIIGHLLTDIEGKEERSLIIAGALRVMACAVNGAEAHSELVNAAIEIETYSRAMINRANQAEDEEWANQRHDEEHRGRFMEGSK